ncbi:M48 family metallopeptidase [Flavimaricola marinus]|uniref:Metalloprotease LoiP n=1 Tax=Flavimaricola marinus TaxID=1819565 RepID=A0A238LA22_9RHOB|nr:M48 family metallopeptidase [Flavimaricola marinus]SMY06451.1 Metalloprotease LoiP precursor [Flavimaricola marinus]
MTERTIIAVGSRAAPYHANGRLFDGQSPVAQPVALSFDDAAKTLVIATDEGDIAHQWPFESLRRVPGAAADQLVVSSTDAGDARLHMPGGDARLIRTRAPKLDRRHLRVRRGRLAGLVVAAVAAVALMLAVLVPALADRLANYLPPEGEAALGEATLAQVRNALGDALMGPLPMCDGPEGLEALAALQDRLSPEADVTVRVLDHPMVNAFALPGGVVILFDGLIQTADSAEEVAAVLAHETGHVVARDPTRTALRSAGSIGVLDLLFGDFAGGAMVLFLTERIISASYTQEAEAAADSYAHEALARASISPAAIATLFERIKAERGDADPIVQHFLAHPAMADRIEAARAAVPEGQRTEPALSDAAWAGLRAICD